MAVIEWHEFYSEWTVEDYYRHVKAVKGFAHRLMRYTPKDGAILEFGHGTGQIAIYLSLSHPKLSVVGMDKDVIQVSRAVILADKLESDVRFSQIDILKLKKIPKPFHIFDTVYSQGLLEHFSDKDIKFIIEKKLLMGKVSAFSVPLKDFGHKSRGDERLMEWDWWLEFVKDYEILYQETYAKNTQGMVIFKEKG
jgi:SAM-dependent methyltransferase